MRLAASNLAWPTDREADALSVLRSRGFEGVEVAPTRVWPSWDGATPAAARALRARLEDEGFAVPALQAVYFGRPEATLFGNGRAGFLEHGRRVAALAEALGAPVVVLGAPRQRAPGTLSPGQAFLEAVEAFRELGEVFAAHGVRLCIEPNPAAYGCAFVRTPQEGARLVAAVSSPGFGLHLDAAATMMEDLDLTDEIRGLAGRFCHFHASEPDLGHPSPGVVDHAAAGDALRGCFYGGWVSLEMKEAPPGTEPLAYLDRACLAVAAAYGEVRPQ
jgi:sugar phosphate isomerase/epimerase